MQEERNPDDAPIIDLPTGIQPIDRTHLGD